MEQRIGHYTITSELGRGGMGVVYKAHEESLNREVALKVLSEHLTQDEDHLKRFLQEARSIARLSHPNIVQIYFVGQDGGRHYFAMEYVRGRSLQDLIQAEGKIENPRAAQLVLQAATGLAAAHERGILHRDIKPANLLLGDDGILKIADFGLAIVADGATRLTADGMLIGTPRYLSPEQCRGEQPDERSDIYSLGVTFYEMLSGKVPFKAASPLALVREITELQATPIHEVAPDVDDRTQRILGLMMAKEPDDRYASTHDLEAALQAYLMRHVMPGWERSSGARPVAAPPPGPPPAAPPTPAPAAQSGDGVSDLLPPLPDSAAQPAPPSGLEPTMRVDSSADLESPTDASAAVAPSTEIEVLPAASSALAPAQPVALSQRSSGSTTRFLAFLAVIVLLLAASAVLAWRMGIFDRGAESTAQLLGAESELSTGADDTAVTGAGEQANGDSAGATGESATGGPAATTAAAAGATGAPDQSLTDGGESASGGPASQQAATSSSGGAPAATGSDSAAAGGALAGSGSLTGAAAAADATTPATTTPAAATPNEAAPPIPTSGTAIVTVGSDPTLAGDVESYLEQRLANAGIDLVDEKGLPGIWDLLSSGSAGSDQLISALRYEARTVVVARVDLVGERELQYLGRYERAYQSRVTIQAIDSGTDRPLLPSRSTTVEYTQVQTERAVREALSPIALELMQALKN